MIRIAPLLALLTFLMTPSAARPDEAGLWLGRLTEATGGRALYESLTRMEVDREFLEPIDEREGGERLSGHSMEVEPGRGIVVRPEDPDQPALRFDLERGQVTLEPVGGESQPADETTRLWLAGFYWRIWWVVVADHAAGRLPEGVVELHESLHHDGRDVVRLAVKPPAAPHYWLEVDRRTGLPVRRLFGFVDGHPSTDDSFHDFRDVGGFLLPHKILSRTDDELREDIRMTRYAPSSSSK